MRSLHDAAATRVVVVRYNNVDYMQPRALTGNLTIVPATQHLHTCVQALTDVNTFELQLDQPGCFQNRDAIGWVSARDEGQIGQLVALQKRLSDLFSDCAAHERHRFQGDAEFTPHMTMGQWANKRDALSAVHNMQVRPTASCLQL